MHDTGPAARHRTHSTGPIAQHRTHSTAQDPQHDTGPTAQHSSMMNCSEGNPPMSKRRCMQVCTQSDASKTLNNNRPRILNNRALVFSEDVLLLLLITPWIILLLNNINYRFVVIRAFLSFSHGPSPKNRTSLFNVLQ